MRRLLSKLFSVSIIILLLFAIPILGQQTGGQDVWATNLTVTDSFYNYAFFRQFYAGTGTNFQSNYLGTGGLLFDWRADNISVFLCTKAGSAYLLGPLTTYMLGLKDTDRSHALVLKWNENDIADRSLNFLVNGANRTIDLSNDLVITALTNTRLLATDGVGDIVSSDLAAWMTGTANRISVTDNGDGTVTLSTPQDTHVGATPTFVSMIGTGLTASRLLSSNGSKTLTSADLFAWVAGTSNQIAVANDGDGTITLSTPQDIHTGAIPTFAGQILTGTTNPLLDLNPSSTNTQTTIDIVPTGAMAASQTFIGLNLNGAALDPSGANAVLYGSYFDMSGVSLANDPDLYGFNIIMPASYSGVGDVFGGRITGNGTTITFLENNFAIHIDDGYIMMDFVAPNTAETLHHMFVADLNVSQLPATSLIHVLDVSVIGTTSGEVAAVGTFPGVEVIHQHTGVPAIPNQVNYAARWPSGGAWTAGIDGNQIMVANNDEIFIGDPDIFDALFVDLSVFASKDVKPEYFYYDTGLVWVEFFPGDTTDGWRADGIVEWNPVSFINWKSDYNPGGGGAGYFIKVARTRVSALTPPTVTTVKILASTTFGWDENGDVEINSLTVNNVGLPLDDFIKANDFKPAEGAGNIVPTIRPDRTNNRMYNRSESNEDTQSIVWCTQHQLPQLASGITTAKIRVRASDFANCAVTWVWEDQDGNADATGSVTITPSGNDVWQEFTYTFTSAYTSLEDVWSEVTISSLDTGDTADFSGMDIVYP